MSDNQDQSAVLSETAENALAQLADEYPENIVKVIRLVLARYNNRQDKPSGPEPVKVDERGKGRRVWGNSAQTLDEFVARARGF